MKLGASYYPELVDESEWPRDLANMKAAGLGVIRMLDFAWSAVEPREGCYEFGWLDRFLDLAQGAGFEAVLCTPTAAPPAWLVTQYPQVRIELRDGTVRHFGGRRDVDVDSCIFRHYAAELAGVLGRRYGKHPAVIGWQIDNELIGPEAAPPECHTPESTFRFRQWLKAAHGTVEALNRRWGTRFWSQEYSDWGEIATPRNVRATPGHIIDYARYFTHSQVEFIRIQYAALRGAIDARQFISHNSTGVFDRGLDHMDYAEPLDVAGWDAYFGAAGRPCPEAFAALAHDMFRSAKRRPFWAFETGSDFADTSMAFLGEMRAHGAIGVIFWHWRSHRANAEQGPGAICDFAGRPHERKVAFIRALAARPELARPLPESPAPRPTAVVYSPDCVRVEISPDPYKRTPLPYLHSLIYAYQALWKQGIATDVVRPGDDLAGRRLVVMASLRLMGEDAAARVRDFVSAGGTLLATAKTAHMDPWGAYYSTPGALLADVLGFTMREDTFVVEPPGIALETGQTFDAKPYVERIEPQSCQVLGRFVGGPLGGAPAVVRHRFGRGTVYYAAACSQDLNTHLARLAAADAGVAAFENAADDLSVVPHLAGDGTWFFNYSHEPRTVGGVTVPPRDFVLGAMLSLAKA